MLCLMVDPKFKSLRLIFFFLGHEKGVNIVENMIDNHYIYWNVIIIYIQWQNLKLHV
jgi:hypothetical protein